jgi:threonine/homoserine/homoserine lactone efflux protein
MLEFLWLASLGFMVAVSGIVVPGPVLILVFHQAATRGFKGGFLVVLAHALVAGVIIILLVTGLSFLFQWKSFQFYIGTIGGFSLTLLGLILLKGFKDHASKLNFQVKASSVNPFFGGLIVSVSNPQFFLWWAVIGLPMLNYAMELGKTVGILAWAMGGLTALFAWYGSLSYLLARSKRKIKRFLPYLTLVCGFFLIAMGILFLLKYLVNLF